MKPGTQVTVMHKGEPCAARIVRVNGSEPVHHGSSFTYHAVLGGDVLTDGGTIWMADEGRTWLTDWNEENAAILRATGALEPEPEFNFDGRTATGRMNSSRPNIANVPRYANGRKAR